MAAQERTSRDRKTSPPPAVSGRILHTSGDACILNLGEYGKGRLKQEYSLARDGSEPLEDLPAYQPGCELRVCLERRAAPDGLWYVNERWAHNRTWETLQLNVNDTVEGTIARGGAGGYFVRLAYPDIDAWLSEREVPWADGSLGEEPRTEGAPRFLLERGDPVRGLVIRIHYPPNYPAISIRRYLEKQEQQRADSIRVATPDPASQLRFSAHIEGDLADLRRRLAPRLPLEGKRLLVIDDDREALQAMVMLLEQNGAHTRAIEVERRLSDAIESVHRALDEQDCDLMLIDYSLPVKGEGLRLAEDLKARQRPLPRMVLFSGYPLESHDSERFQAIGIDGFMRKPLRLDRLLACLAGELVWESNNTTQETHLKNDGSLPALEGGPERLLEQFHQKCHLRYAVLLEVTSPQRLDPLVCHGTFPRKRRALDDLLLVTDLKSLVRGYWHEFHVQPEPTQRNEYLLTFSKHARFLILGTKRVPRFVLGLGWDDKTAPFNELELRTFALLLEARLEHDITERWIRDQLPFLVQGQLLIGLTHEIRARLSPWLHYQEALKACWQSYTVSEGEQRQGQQAAIERALNGMERAYGGLHELLEMMLGGLHQRGQVCRLRPLFDQLYQLFEGELKQHGVRLEIAEPPDLCLAFSPLYLLQPLSNLILNSRKHMHRPVGGRVGVSADIASISPGDPRQWLVVEVEDNGPGIPAHVYPHIFEPGYSHAPLASERTGMGLFVSRLLVRRIGGELEDPKNWRAVGCRFRLRLPLLCSG